MSASATHQNLYAFLFYRGLVVRGGAHPHQGVHAVRLQILHTQTHPVRPPPPTTPPSEIWENNEREMHELFRPFYLYEPSQLCVGGVVRNEEPQTVVGDLHGGRPVHVWSHKRGFEDKKWSGKVLCFKEWSNRQRPQSSKSSGCFKKKRTRFKEKLLVN